MISVGFKTDRGISRTDNEDSVFVMPDKQLFMVADGVGGHNSGELASRMTVGYMAQFVSLHPIETVKSEIALKDYFLSLFAGANELVFKKSLSEEENRGMATTALLCYLRNNKAYVINVGDSRAYLIRDGVLRQVTKDHTLVQEMVDKGLITNTEAEQRTDKNLITRAVGGDMSVYPDFFAFDVYPGDTIIMCSDGLYGELEESTMAGMAYSASTMHSLAKDLVDAANRHGGSDNISVVCIRIQ
ncbi:MAG: Stp1/IreP family PP2C-type Ser/Thr phosphatase [Clostridia bacterium]|nr:Stp1/IreP family PP2C-type Ser/Thr phosphatase [Clostridia bacterium]